MIRHDATPISNRSRLRRIPLNEPLPEMRQLYPDPPRSIAEMLEIDRIWALVRSSSEGN